MEDKETKKDATTMVKVFHSSSSTDTKQKPSDEERVFVTMFKTVKCTPEYTVADAIEHVLMKLKLKASNKYNIYSLDAEYDYIKRKLEPNEKLVELVNADISNKLKLVVLSDEEAGKLGKVGGGRPIEFYELNGNVVVGNLPRIKDKYLPSATSATKHRKLLNMNDFSQFMNLTFIVEGERICSLRAIIEKRCPSLLLAVNFIKKKKEKKGDFLGPITIEYKENTILSKFVLYQILDWCYTGTLEFVELRLPDVLVILLAAQQLSIPHLVWVCEQYIRSELSIYTVFILLKQATALKMESIKELALEFAHEKWSQVATNREGMELIGIELFQELTIEMQQRNANPKSPKQLVDQTPVPNTVKEDFRAVYTDRMFTDAEAIFPLGGDPIKFHRAILAAYSRPLLNVISQSKSKQFSFEGLSPTAFSDFLQYVYYGRTLFDPIGSCLLFEYALVPYSLEGVREHLLDAFSSGISLESVLMILRVTYLPQGRQRVSPKLRATLLHFICENFSALDIPGLRSVEPFDVGFQMMADILDALYAYRDKADFKPPIRRNVSEILPGGDHCNKKSDHREKFRRVESSPRNSDYSKTKKTKKSH